MAGTIDGPRQSERERVRERGGRGSNRGVVAIAVSEEGATVLCGVDDDKEGKCGGRAAHTQ